MSWLLFMDESGHDHKQLPYEVRGGVAIHAGKVWAFVQKLQELEMDSFGVHLSEYKSELKGHKLLDKDRFGWAEQMPPMDRDVRHKFCRAFLTKGLERKSPLREEFAAYGQACMKMAVGVFGLLEAHSAVLFAAAIKRGVKPPEDYDRPEHLRKDQVFLLERFFYFLESKREHGILVMDEIDKAEDRRFVRRLQSYFRETSTGKHRSQWIVPTPFFVASDMAYPVQVADLCIYCVNWGFRVGSMNEPTRTEIESRFGPLLKRIEFKGDGYRDGATFKCFGVVYVPDRLLLGRLGGRRQRRRSHPKAAPRPSLHR